MSKAKSRLRFFLDQNAPESVGKMLQSAGHEVEFLRHHLATDAKDNVVAATAIQNSAILISADKDFKGLGKAAGLTRREVHTLHRALIRCKDPEAPQRFKESLDFIEYEWNRVPKGGVLYVEVHSSFLRTNR